MSTPVFRISRAPSDAPIASLTACALALLSGCAGSSAERGPSTTLRAADFSGRTSAASRAGASAPPTVRPEVVRGAVEATGAIDDVHVVVGPPTLPARKAAPAPVAAAAPAPEAARTEPGSTPDPGAPGPPAAPASAPTPGATSGGVVVDALVGQINGRPVYASEFFAPLESRLRAEARTARSVEEWLRRKGGVREQILGALIDRLRDELLLAEFESALSPAQRVGLLAFVEDLRGNLKSLAEGSEELANRRLLDAEGVTFEEKVKLERDRELIRAQINKILKDRAHVAWREVVQTYERERSEFNPAPKARFRVIQAPVADAERTGRIEAAIAAGEDWETIARRDGGFSSAQGGLLEVEVAEEGFEKTTFFGVPALNDPASALTPGQSAQVEWSGSKYWIRLDEVEQPRSVSLYDAQLYIRAALLRQREGEEGQKYLNELRKRASASDLEEMGLKLERLAVTRYWPGPR